ncbi:hypothetical protein GGR43_004632 [Sphingobium jiangsuense]|uniref:Uncharacterized protein n=1 Tax=Sphingobium jiangsuense TaxID=870476 RepID=A0A7W6FSL5_9SPHN|nr:hypothetical protein [Sphingobium jiangsuense]
MTPPESAILREMQATGFDRHVCVNRLRSLEIIVRRKNDRRYTR